MVNEEDVRMVIIDDIVKREFDMFQRVRTQIPNWCKEHTHNFKQLRVATHSVLSIGTLKSYHRDLLAAEDNDKNLVELKYARMDHLVPCLNISPIIDKIVEIEGRWLRELEERYPLLFKDASGLNGRFNLRSELETYSDQTIESYCDDILAAVAEGENLAAKRYTSLIRQMGYNSLDDMEKEREKNTAGLLSIIENLDCD